MRNRPPELQEFFEDHGVPLEVGMRVKTLPYNDKEFVVVLICLNYDSSVRARILDEVFGAMMFFNPTELTPII